MTTKKKNMIRLKSEAGGDNDLVFVSFFRFYIDIYIFVFFFLVFFEAWCMWGWMGWLSERVDGLHQWDCMGGRRTWMSV